MSLTTVYNTDGKARDTTAVPSVIRYSPIRPDVVHFVHMNLAKNERQPYGRYYLAGHQHSAESWGTGRAVARVPRISGSGTSRNGQAAFANSARGGHMYSPLKVWRRWHRMVNVTQRRYAMCSAIAASSNPSLVLARGHKIDNVPELPLVVSDDVEQIKKTKEAVKVLAALKASDDVKHSAESKRIRCGSGKSRNRRYTQRRGVLIVHDQNEGLVNAFRNISGVDIANVNRLNIRDLAPGGHLGRFIIWTEGAYKKLDKLYGTRFRTALLKNQYKHPTPSVTNTDLSRIIHSPTVQSVFKTPGNKSKKIINVRRNLLIASKLSQNNARIKKLQKLRKESGDKKKEGEGEKIKKRRKAKKVYRNEVGDIVKKEDKLKSIKDKVDKARSEKEARKASKLKKIADEREKVKKAKEAKQAELALLEERRKAKKEKDLALKKAEPEVKPVEKKRDEKKIAEKKLKEKKRREEKLRQLILLKEKKAADKKKEEALAASKVVEKKEEPEAKPADKKGGDKKGGDKKEEKKDDKKDAKKDDKKPADKAKGGKK